MAARCLERSRNVSCVPEKFACRNPKQEVTIRPALFATVSWVCLAVAACSPNTAQIGDGPAPGDGSNGSDGYTELTWPEQQPTIHYTLPSGTLVTKVGGRTRDRHAREMPPKGDPMGGDNYMTFAAHYFERRTHDITIYDNPNPDPKKPGTRILTLVVRPQWWLYGTNFRGGYIGRRGDEPYLPMSVALYGDNGGMKQQPPGTLLKDQELKTPIENYDALPDNNSPSTYRDLKVPLADGEFVLVKQITRSPALNRDLREGDLYEFELGIFLDGTKGDELGRFNYYSDALVYRVGSPGIVPWYRGPCCDAPSIPWDSTPIPDSALAGGKMMTLQEDTSGFTHINFMQASLNIAGRNIQAFTEGRRLIHTSFLTGGHHEPGNPPVTAAMNKAGPRFQQASCIDCHVNNGKSSPALNAPLSTMVVLTADVDDTGKLVPDSRFGGHLWQGVVNDGKTQYDGRNAVLKITAYREIPGQYPDGTAYTLQEPIYSLTDRMGKPLEMPARMSVHTAPHMVGMGLLEAVPESQLKALADASRHDADGAVGKLQLIPDPRSPSVIRVGRFGWRGTASTVEEQVSGALNNDMGVTTSMFPTHNCGLAKDDADCRNANSTTPEISNEDVRRIVDYTSLLAVPPQRHFPGEQPLRNYAVDFGALVQDPDQSKLEAELAKMREDEAAERQMQERVAAGSVLFKQARCNACHVATLTTGTAHRYAELREQTIHPYTDLLLHDMGPELGDNYPQGVATGQEWRTAPLWSLGLLEHTNPGARFLHDGRARTIEEAILWHGGQGRASRDRFKAMSKEERGKLIDFVKSL
ncbi:di-heme oxidoredictase family protein [Vitiosangium sp. GDMCC 1.1324]|uniref:di-heme oxidoredictase family protein n=1 Tax=Vitiosangium sp. (strain GDMCC 1.1324) TaxID=2138576 RepID=UPI0011B4B2BD|nr:di-heme oxidoredictase family protein [Vitiosangium sp. GDMCC 1.1324]